jgi:hypothetical protein
VKQREDKYICSCLAAVRNGNFILDEVLNQDILNKNCVEWPVDYLQKVMQALGSFTLEKSCQNVEFFVNECTEQVETVLEAHDSLD